MPFLTMLKSICSIIVEPRSGHNPEPVILMQLVSFNRLTLVDASIKTKTASTSSSHNFAARSFSISPKSRVPQSSPKIADRKSENKDISCVSRSSATANRARDGAARKLDTCDSGSFGSVERVLLLLRYGVLSSDTFLLLDESNAVMDFPMVTVWMR